MAEFNGPFDGNEFNITNCSEECKKEKAHLRKLLDDTFDYVRLQEQRVWWMEQELIKMSKKCRKNDKKKIIDRTFKLIEKIFARK